MHTLRTEELVGPVRDVVTGLRRQLLLDVQEELLGEDGVANVWKDNHLEYLGLLLMVPRVLCLLVLLFGMLTASIWVCQMQIIQAIEPKRVVSAYGKVTNRESLYSVSFIYGTYDNSIRLFSHLSSKQLSNQYLNTYRTLS